MGRKKTRPTHSALSDRLPTFGDRSMVTRAAPRAIAAMITEAGPTYSI
jgi:hypothetical protein